MNYFLARCAGYLGKCLFLEEEKEKHIKCALNAVDHHPVYL